MSSYVQTPRFLDFSEDLCYAQPWHGTGHNLRSCAAGRHFLCYVQPHEEWSWPAAPYHANILSQEEHLTQKIMEP